MGKWVKCTRLSYTGRQMLLYVQNRQACFCLCRLLSQNHVHVYTQHKLTSLCLWHKPKQAFAHIYTPTQPQYPCVVCIVVEEVSLKNWSSLQNVALS